MHGFPFIQDLAIILVVAGVVGWVCQRIGLSVVVGFLVAGMLVGPNTPPLMLVKDYGRVETLAQVGLVFLMFSLGLQLSFQKLRRLGLSLIVATVLSTVLMYQLSRLLAVSFGWSAREGLFLAGMLMVSSSAVIGRILHESGKNHERAGQYATGMSVLEDVAGIAMLTIFASMVQMEKGPGSHVPQTLLMLGAFAVLAGIAGLLLVPWLLKRMIAASSDELQTLGITGLLFSLAIVAQAAGYSLALGAFLLGVIVAETPHRHQVERTFESMRDVFSAVFFVAVGMQIDARDLWAEGPLIAGIAAFTLVARPLAIATGMGLVGKPLKDALKTGLTVIPIGEFSFIIAYIGVTALVLPSRFFPLAVGVSIITTLAAPVIVRHSEAIAKTVVSRQPAWLATWFRVYQSWLLRLQKRGSRNLLWQVSRKRIVQVSVGMLFVTGLIVFSGQLFAVVDDWLGRQFSPRSVELGFWIALGLIVLAPLVAIWRNLSAMALVYAQITTKGLPQARRLRPLVETTLKVGAGAMMYVWLVAILPADGKTRWVLMVSALVAVVALLALRRKLIHWHSGMEFEIQSVLETGGTKLAASSTPWLQRHGEWNLHIVDCTLPDLAVCQGRQIAELDLRARFGCSVVGIERQGFMIPLPPADTVLYPRDKVLLLGTNDQVHAGRKFLVSVEGRDGQDSVFEDVRMESMVIPPWSRAAGRRLDALAPGNDHGIQIAGVHRGGLRILNPGASETLRAEDEILVLGTPVQIAEFSAWLRENPEEEIDGKGGPAE